MANHTHNDLNDMLEGEREIKEHYPRYSLNTSERHDNAVLSHALSAAAKKRQQATVHAFPVKKKPRFVVPVSMAAGLVIGVSIMLVYNVSQQSSSLITSPQVAGQPLSQDHLEITSAKTPQSDKEKMNQQIQVLIQQDRISEAEALLQRYKKLHLLSLPAE